MSDYCSNCEGGKIRVDCECIDRDIDVCCFRYEKCNDTQEIFIKCEECQGTGYPSNLDLLNQIKLLKEDLLEIKNNLKKLSLINNSFEENQKIP